MDFKYLVLDLETNGFKPSTYCGVTELTAIAVTGDFKTHKQVYDGLLDPGSPIPQKLVDFNGINDEMVKGRPQWKSVLTQVLLLAKQKDLIIIAHNTDFEKTFFNYACKVEGTKWGDTGGLFVERNKDLFPKSRYNKGWNLKTACGTFDIPFDNDKAHRARYDVLRTIDLLEALNTPIENICPNYERFTGIKQTKVEKQLQTEFSDGHWTKQKINEEISNYFKNKTLVLGERLIVECRRIPKDERSKWVNNFAEASSNGKYIRFEINND